MPPPFTQTHATAIASPERSSQTSCRCLQACWSVEGLGALIDAGMNVARLNFSHGNHDSHSASLDRLREARKSCLQTLPTLVSLASYEYTLRLV